MGGIVVNLIRLAGYLHCASHSHPSVTLAAGEMTPSAGLCMHYTHVYISPPTYDSKLIFKK